MTNNSSQVTSQCNTHKSITPALPRLPVGDDHRLLNVTELLEELPETLVGGVVGQTPDEDLRVGGILLRNSRCRHHLVWLVEGRIEVKI